jgi:hypothetical protein
MTWPTFFFGTLIQTIGVGMVAYAMYTEQSPLIFGMMALVGMGTGLRLMSAALHGIGIFRKDRAAVIGLLSLAFPLGGTIGLTIMSTVFNNTSNFDSSGDFSAIRDLPSALQAEYKESVKMGLVWSFVAITPLLLLSWFATFFLGNVKVGKGHGPDEDGTQNTVIEDIYLLTLLRDRHSKQGQEEADLMGNTVPVPRSVELKRGDGPMPALPGMHDSESAERRLL